MRQAKHSIKLDETDTKVAQWETSGNDWLVLYRYESERFGTVYAYKGNGQGGGLNCNPDLDPAVFGPVVKTDDEAIAELERSWNERGRGGAGAAFVLRQDRPSLRRVHFA